MSYSPDVVFFPQRTGVFDFAGSLRVDSLHRLDRMIFIICLRGIEEVAWNPNPGSPRPRATPPMRVSHGTCGRRQPEKLESIRSRNETHTPRYRHFARQIWFSRDQDRPVPGEGCVRVVSDPFGRSNVKICECLPRMATGYFRCTSVARKTVNGSKDFLWSSWY